MDEEIFELDIKDTQTLWAREKVQGLKKMRSSNPVELAHKVYIMDLYKVGLER